MPKRKAGNDGKVEEEKKEKAGRRAIKYSFWEQQEAAHHHAVNEMGKPRFGCFID